MNIYQIFFNFLIVFFVIGSNVENTNSSNIPSVEEYFPNLTDDLTTLTWAHAVNNQTLLKESIKNTNVMMLEADVSLGKLIGGSDVVIPIMAHPPSNVSDLSLQQFILAVIDAQEKNKKGIKLDFKSTQVFIESWSVLDLYSNKFVFPVWLNADILLGPVNSTTTPVDPDVFLSMAVNKLPTTTLSLGWTTRYGPLTHGQYTQQQLDSMKSLIFNYNILQPVTFAVRAGIVAESKDGILDLVNSIDQFQKSNLTTVTIWMSNNIDPVDVPNLRDVIFSLGKKKVFLDVPESLRDELMLNKGTSVAVHAAKSVLVSFLTSISAVFSGMFHWFK